MLGRILIAIALYLCYRGIKHLLISDKSNFYKKKVVEECDSMVKCEGCEIYISETDAIKSTKNNKLSYFCSNKCKNS